MLELQHIRATKPLMERFPEHAHADGSSHISPGLPCLLEYRSESASSDEGEGLDQHVISSDVHWVDHPASSGEYSGDDKDGLFRSPSHRGVRRDTAPDHKDLSGDSVISMDHMERSQRGVSSPHLSPDALSHQYTPQSSAIIERGYSPMGSYGGQRSPLEPLCVMPHASARSDHLPATIPAPVPRAFNSQCSNFGLYPPSVEVSCLPGGQISPLGSPGTMTGSLSASTCPQPYVAHSMSALPMSSQEVQVHHLQQESQTNYHSRFSEGHTHVPRDFQGHGPSPPTSATTTTATTKTESPVNTNGPPVILTVPTAHASTGGSSKMTTPEPSSQRQSTSDFLESNTVQLRTSKNKSAKQFPVDNLSDDGIILTIQRAYNDMAATINKKVSY